MSITVYLRWAEFDGVIFNFVPLDSTQWAWNPSSSSWLPHRTIVGFLPSTGKSRTSPEPECHDPNPQLTERSATGSEVCWHGKHSLGHEWSQRIGPGLEPMLLNIPQNQKFPFFPPPSFPPWAFYSARAEAWYRLECWNLSDSKTRTTVTTIIVENVHIWVLMRRVCKVPSIQRRWNLYCNYITHITLPNNITLVRCQRYFSSTCHLGR